MDFVFDALANGRRIKCLAVVDDFTRESVDVAVDHSIGGAYGVRLLDQAAYPRVVRTDNGPEFTSHAFIAWAQRHGIEHILIEPGAPTQNAYIESFNGKFRDECLNEHWFTSLPQARDVANAWRRHYNTIRPHSRCGRIPPAPPPTTAHNKPTTQHLSTPGVVSNNWYAAWGLVSIAQDFHQRALLQVVRHMEAPHLRDAQAKPDAGQIAFGTGDAERTGQCEGA